MPYREIFECDLCGREMECAFYFRWNGDDPWKYTADDREPEEGNEMECSGCHKRNNP